MAHKFTFTVEIELERESGKFASRDELADALIAEIEGVEPYGVIGVGADGDSEYSITQFDVSEA